MEELDLILKAQKGDELAKNILIGNYEPLIISIINKKNFYIEGEEFQDLVQEGRLALFNAVKNYDPNRNAKFSTYAKTLIENHLINVIKSSQNSKNMALNSALGLNNQGEVELEELPLPVKPTRSIEEDYIGEQNAKELIDSIIQNLSPLENQILQYKLQDYTYTEIAKKLNLDSKKVDNALNRIKNKITRIKNQ